MVYRLVLYYEATPILMVDIRLEFILPIIQAIIPYLDIHNLNREPYTLGVMDKQLGEYVRMEVQRYYGLGKK